MCLFIYSFGYVFVCIHDTAGQQCVSVQTWQNSAGMICSRNIAKYHIYTHTRTHTHTHTNEPISAALEGKTRIEERLAARSMELEQAAQQQQQQGADVVLAHDAEVKALRVQLQQAADSSATLQIKLQVCLCMCGCKRVC